MRKFAEFYTAHNWAAAAAQILWGIQNENNNIFKIGFSYERNF